MISDYVSNMNNLIYPFMDLEKSNVRPASPKSSSLSFAISIGERLKSNTYSVKYLNKLEI